MNFELKKVVMTCVLVLELAFGAAIALTGPSLGNTATLPDSGSAVVTEYTPASCTDQKCAYEPDSTNGYHRPSGGTSAGLKLY